MAQSRINVFATSPMVRTKIRHPSGNLGFPADESKPARWPDDQFTQRRLADGDISLEAPTSSKPAESEPASTNPTMPFDKEQ